MPARDPNLRMEASKWAETPEDRAYYETLNDDQLRSILVGLAASKGERELPVDAPANLKARASSSMRPASSEQYAPESPTSARRVLEGPERAAKGLGVGAAAAALPASMGIAGPLAPSILGLYAATQAGEGLGNVAEGNYGRGAGQLALAALPYTGRLASLLRADPEAAFIQKMRTGGAPRPYGPSRGVDVPYRGPSGVDIPSDVEGLVERGTQRGLRNATRARAAAARPQEELDAFNTTRGQTQNRLENPEEFRESLQGIREAMVGPDRLPAPELPTSWRPYARTVEGRVGQSTAAIRDAKKLQPQSRSSLRPRGYKPRENGPQSPKSRYDKK